MAYYIDDDKIKLLPKAGVSLCLGDFDGVHLGHQALLEEARTGGAYALLFDEDVSRLIPNGKEPKVLMGIPERVAMIEGILGREAILMHAEASLFSLSPEEFIERVLKPLHAKRIYVGADYRFGRGAKGNVDTLREHFEVTAIPLLAQDGYKVATRTIKSLLKEGNLEKANEALGRPYEVLGSIEHGLGNGHKLGFPTLNLRLKEDYLLPKVGVYGGLLKHDGKAYRCIINYGIHPSLSMLNEPIIEAHLLLGDDEKAPSYGDEVALSFMHWRREEMHFPSLEALESQLEEDRLWRALLPQ